jgi:hypothetical protein
MVTAALACASSARAQEPYFHGLGERTPSDPVCPAPVGYFNGLGAECHVWEVRDDIGFGNQRVLTDQLELASAIPVLPGHRTVTLVIRTTVATDTRTTTGFYGIHGPIWSLGLRIRSPSDYHFFEAGLRLIPGWAGPNDADPRALQLAYDASMTSGIGDDARWLPLASTGLQVYLWTRSRAKISAGNTELFLGTEYGGEVSLAPLQVQSWLGAQSGIVGNAIAEIQLGAPRIAGRIAGVELGGHADVSLSSIWPAADPLPMHLNAFLAVNPFDALTARIFYGVAGSPQGSWANPYGARLEYYFR